MTMERTLPADWRRDDAPGAELTNSTLKQRCAARNLSVQGGRSEMIERLDHHQKVSGTAHRLRSWRNQPSDDFSSKFYVLRYVLNCPEPLRWQRSFLPTELEDIYRHSNVVSTRLLTKCNDQNPLCALCFKVVVPTEGHSTCCVTCGRTMHTECVGVAQKARALTKEENCWRCEDKNQWGLRIVKYCEPGQVKYPPVVPGTQAAPQTLPGPGGNTAQQSNERTESGAVATEDFGSSCGEHSGQQANNPPSISADPAFRTAASAATPDPALALTSGTASVEHPVSTTMNANSSDRDSAELVQDRNHMAKQLAEMRKRAKRKHQKLNKKHKKEIKNLRKKSKRALERLMKRSNELEEKARGLRGEREGCDDA
ncbi:hypothetical protein GE21DRAFT_6554 [Neurospora crassa]|uniref:SAP domain-containing protein n=1 Tax=Neurospora crassa (strain ATCC 24698 / 74-OR23-1A / CBS 708.71 / DSM 1257 / FGSC 987) TaxID=367110 RepID=Q7S8Y1_NEUCR|nr:hypothetical protein NCU08834 [Neurospora crassa OR74A]EAA32809.2 hypothetical protein NCU08834 [Neurospora crassa OR74A]KHE79777.1 hypothetical protein GE21DRAFT_6554 [Neurospora crassa]|eukprot:XP_962045.2 hypothetical protein NCU08834 [Neurospora crassa OR74A]